MHQQFLGSFNKMPEKILEWIFNDFMEHRIMKHWLNFLYLFLNTNG